jgi:arabinofuranan 3-O-arabinosyltransferase
MTRLEAGFHRVLGRRARHATSGWVHAGLAVLSYAPLLVTAQGRVAADTRQDLYIDPGRFLSQALTVWDPSRHLGGVTHQNIGLVFPMGSFFWVFRQLTIPIWLAQRLWLGTILFLAGAGVLYLARTLNWRGAGPVVAAVAYAMSPYVLQYAPRTSVLLLPWAGLPWLIGLTDRALRTGSWRHPALFALVTLAVGGVNATAVVLIGLGPALYLVITVFVRHEIAVRAGVHTALRIAALAIATSIWWVVALRVEGGYGLPLLSYTETVDQVATSSSASELLRGLGYWLFYTSERLYPETAGSATYLDSGVILVLSFLVPVLAIAGACVTRWRHRAYFIALIVVGVVVGVGAYPSSGRSPLGSLFGDFARESTLGLAFRSTTRAAPLAILGLAALLGALVTAVASRVRVQGLVLGVTVIALVVVSAPSYATDQLVDSHFDRPEDLPSYWDAAGRYVDAHAAGRRVLEVPGIRFAAYRWGTTYEPISPIVFDAPVAAREQIPFGGVGAADLMIALDHRMQEGVLEPDAIAPIARLVSAGQVLVRSDLAFERFDTVDPRVLWGALVPRTAGLGPPAAFGLTTANVPVAEARSIDARQLRIPTGKGDPARVVVFAVESAPAIVHASPVSSTTLLDGDGEGIVDASAVGLIDGTGAVLYAASTVNDTTTFDRAVASGVPIIVTDTNRRRVRRWRSTRNTTGATLRADEDPDSSTGGSGGEAPLEVFPDAGSSWQTVRVSRGARVSASQYGGPVLFDPGAQPTAAFDGDPTTAWSVGPLLGGIGDRLTITVDDPITTDHIDLLTQSGRSLLTGVGLSFDGDPPVPVTLDESSRVGSGQRIEFPSRRFKRLDIVLTSSQDTAEAAVYGRGPLSIAELKIPGITVDDLMRLPVALLDRLGAAANDHALTFEVTRLRADPAEVVDVTAELHDQPVFRDEEPSINRIVDVPTAREFSISGQARLSTAVTDQVVDALMGETNGDVTAVSSSRLPGDAAAHARAAIDGDAATAWISGSDVVGASLQVDLARPTTVDRLDLQVVADGRHSLPSQLEVTVDGQTQFVDVPAITETNTPNAVASVPLALRPATGRSITVTVAKVQQRTTLDPVLFERPQTLPVAIAELGVPGVVSAPLPAALPATCRTDLVRVDDTPISVRLIGSPASALAGDPMTIEACDGTLALGAGQHTIRTAVGRGLGVDVDRLVVSSARGGGPAAVGPAGQPVPATDIASPAVKVVDDSATSKHVRVAASSKPVWLTLGESQNDGWEATVDGKSLGTPVMLDGYANGWYLKPSDHAVDVRLRWTPQRQVDIAVIVSLIAALLCLVLAMRSRRWRPATDGAATSGPVVPVLGLADESGPAAMRVAIVAAALSGIVAGVVVTPLAGPVVGAVVVVVARVPRLRRALTGVGALAVAGAFADVLIERVRHRDVDNFDLFTGLHGAHWAALVGVILIGAAAVASLVGSRATSEGAAAR